MLKLERPLVFFDLETTGLDPLQDRIIQFGAVTVSPDGKESCYETLVNPKGKLPAIITEKTGITDAMLTGAPTLAEVFPQIWSVLQDGDLAGHNIRQFDVPFLFAEAYRLGKPLPGPADRHYVDTWDLLNAYDPELRFKHSLVNAYEALFHAPYIGAHTALADSIAAWRVFQATLARLDLDMATPAMLEKWAWEQNAANRKAFHKYLREQRQGAPASTVSH